MKGCRPLSKEESKSVFEAMTGRYAERNRALFSVGCNTGFRVSELLSINRGDLIESGGKINEYVTVSRRKMKGKHESRTVFLNETARKHLLIWLKKQEEMGYVAADLPVFCKGNAGRLDRRNVWFLLKRAYRKAGLGGKGLATHTMRKTFANNIYNYFLNREKTDPLRTTSKVMGHKSVDSTDSYLSFIEEDIKEGIKAIEQ